MREQFKKLQSKLCEISISFIHYSNIFNDSCIDVISTDVDNVLQRMTIIGVILSFRQILHDALVVVLEERIPFLLSSILDFRHNTNGVDSLVCLFTTKHVC